MRFRCCHHFWLCALLLASSANVASAQPTTPAPVVATPAIRQQLKSAQRVVGAVRPLRSVTVGSALDGRVLKFMVSQGDADTAGQPLAQLRTGTLEIELAAARAELALYRHQLAELENGSRAEDIAEARANMGGAKSAHEIAARRLKRLTTLSESGSVSAAELDDVRQRAAAAEFALKATEALLKRMEQGPRSESIEQARARVDLQLQRTRLLQDRITKCTVVCPFDGFVAVESTEVGAWVSRGDPIAQIIQLDKVEVQAPVTAETAMHIRVGTTIRVEFPAIPDKVWLGELSRIVPVADTRSRTFPIIVQLQNEISNGTPTLMAGMLARLHLPTGQLSDRPLVPKDALVLNGAQRSVYVVQPNKPADTAPDQQDQPTGKVRRVDVRLGVAFESWIQVDGDLAAGDLVVVEGNERLVPGKAVRITQQPGQMPGVKDAQPAAKGAN